MKNEVHTAGFTLIELAIVLAIIGLLTGGILAGRDLIRAAEIRNTIKEFHDLRDAYLNYKSKYNSMPGDDPYATTFWPGITQNGNGDGLISDHGAGDEDGKAMEHLALANLIPLPGPFTAYYPHVIGENMLAAAIGNNAGYRVHSYPWSAIPSQNLYGRRGVAINLGTAINCWDLACAVFRPIDAYNIDIKIDDGKPASGNLYGAGHDSTFHECNPGSNINDGGGNAYNVTHSGVVCALEYWIE